MANVIYNKLKEGLFTGDITLSADDIYVLLVQEYNVSDNIVTSAETLSATLSFEYSGTSGTPLTETSGIGYTSGGYELTNKVVSASSDTAGTIIFDADDITISASTITAGGIVGYQTFGDINNAVPLFYMDLGVDQVSSNGDFKFQWHSTGILTLETKVT
jgi:hypothetical protein